MLQKVATTGIDLDSVYPNTAANKGSEGWPIKAWDRDVNVGIEKGIPVPIRYICR